MNIEQNIKSLIDWGSWIDHALKSDSLNEVLIQARNQNPWFEPEESKRMLNYWANTLNSENIYKWASSYYFNHENIKKIGLILAGNIPLVGMHDIVCVLLSGHYADIKLSSKDTVLMEWVLKGLITVAPQCQEKIKITPLLKKFDAVIATGSANTNRYFESYFGHVPHLLRSSRTSCAVLTGYETDEELQLLGNDVFSYFGLGCRNVGYVLIPKQFEVERLFKITENWEWLKNHHKYFNNYEYQLAKCLINKYEVLDNGMLLLKADDQLFSAIGTLHYGFYENHEQAKAFINNRLDLIQCVVSKYENTFASEVKLGNTQAPTLWDYADGVDTLAFLTQL